MPEAAEIREFGPLREYYPVRGAYSTISSMYAAHMPVLEQELRRLSLRTSQKVGEVRSEEIEGVFIEAVSGLIESELQYRKAGRAKVFVLGADVERRYITRAERINIRAIRHLNSVGELSKKMRATMDKEMWDGFAAAAKTPEVHKGLDYTKEVFTDVLLRWDLSEEEAKEVVEEWDGVVSIAKRTGVDGIWNHIDYRVSELAQVRQSPTRGMEPRSPLPWWKWVLISAVIGYSIYRIVRCLVGKGSCRDLLKEVQNHGGWIASIVSSGC